MNMVILIKSFSSGFLLSYGLLRKLVKTKGRFNYFEFIFQRYIRFIVMSFGSVLFLYIYPLTGTGPIWDEGVGKIVDGCKNPSNMLNNLLFINNFNFHNKENNFNSTQVRKIVNKAKITVCSLFSATP